MRNIIATGQLYGETITLKQVSKIAARKQFEAGNEVYLQSSNMYPFGVWQSVCQIKLDIDKLNSEKQYAEMCKKYVTTGPVYPPTESGQFNAIVDNYSYYNCDSERGNYVHFYVKVN